MIKRLKNHQINKNTWNVVVTTCDNPHVYLLSWYLDVVSPGWECLVWGDYEYIMPLPVKRKWGIPYLVQPLFCQRIGILGIGVNNNIARLFYHKIYWKFPYLNLQTGDNLGLGKSLYLKERVNYTLHLAPSYSVLKRDYHENTVRNIGKAENARLIIAKCDEDIFISFCQHWLKGVNKEQMVVFSSLVKVALGKNVAKILKVTDPKGEILAAACFMIWNHQIYDLAAASSTRGKELSAMFLVFDNIIRDYSGSGYLLDFEGSMIPGVARFYKGFGGKASYYYHLKKYLFL